jgi:hypothetical protein
LKHREFFEEDEAHCAHGCAAAKSNAVPGCVCPANAAEIRNVTKLATFGRRRRAQVFAAQFRRHQAVIQALHAQLEMRED